MNLCDKGHEEVCFEGRNCPVCEKMAEIEMLENDVCDLQVAIERLEADE